MQVKYIGYNTRTNNTHNGTMTIISTIVRTCPKECAWFKELVADPTTRASISAYVSDKFAGWKHRTFEFRVSFKDVGIYINIYLTDTEVQMMDIGLAVDHDQLVLTTTYPPRRNSTSVHSQRQ